MFDDNVYRYIKESELNDYEKENKYLSYANLFYNYDSLILCNNIINDYEDMELINGNNYNEEEEEDTYTEIYQYYIIDDETARRLIENTDTIIYYHNRLDIYVLGVTHYGTNWHYVLTDFKLVKDKDTGFYKAIKIDEDETEDNEEDGI